MSDVVLQDQGTPSGLSLNETAIYPKSDGLFYAKTGSDAERPLETGTISPTKIACCPFGAKSDDTSKFLIANGKSSDADDSSKTKTRQPIVADGTLTKLAYQTKDGTTSTQMKVHINGVVEATVILTNLSGTAKSGVETISISVSAGDYVEIEYDSSDKPGECTMYFLQELS